MDRFKFRIYDIKLEMYRSDGYYINGNQYMDSYFEDVYDLTNDMTVEQCTGLKDKNGNLIYEGDILQNSNKDQYIVEWIVDGYWHIRQIDDEKFGCALANIKTLCNDWEIIGNIHEQKE
jgi:uncharacterized phage protein (TIGR01671 family)